MALWGRGKGQLLAELKMSGPALARGNHPRQTDHLHLLPGFP